MKQGDFRLFRLVEWPIIKPNLFGTTLYRRNVNNTID